MEGFVELISLLTTAKETGVISRLVVTNATVATQSKSV